MRQHQYFISQDQRTFFSDLPTHVPEVLAESKKNGMFDIGIVQLNYHLLVVPWKISFYSFIEDYDPDYKKHLIKFPDCFIGVHQFQNTYVYKHEDTIKKYFEDLRKACKKIIFISMPSSWPEYLQRTIEANNLYSSFCDTTISLPLDPGFPAKHCIDGIHYTSAYAIEISKMVEETIKNLKV